MAQIRLGTSSQLMWCCWTWSTCGWTSRRYREVIVRRLFTEPGWVRRQLIRTSIVWLAYSAGSVAANTYIED